MANRSDAPPLAASWLGCGWAFLVAWVFGLFYLQPSDGEMGARTGLPSTGAFWADVEPLVPVTITVGALVVILLLEKTKGAPSDYPFLFAAAPVAMAVGTPLWALELPGALNIAGALLVSVGSAFLWVLWGEYFCRVGQEQAEWLAPASTMLALVLLVPAAFLDGTALTALSTVYAVVAGASLALAWRGTAAVAAVMPLRDELLALDRAHGEARRNIWDAVASVGRASFGIFFACAATALLGIGAQDQQPLDSAAVLAGLGLAFLLVAIVGFATVTGPRRVSLHFMYRWLCPLLVAGLGAVILLPPSGAAVWGFAVEMSARMGFCLLTQMYYTRLADTGALTPVQAFGWGWICVHFGDLAGCLALIALWDVLSAPAIAMGTIFLLVVATMYVLNDPRTFHASLQVGRRQETAGGEAALAAAMGEAVAPGSGATPAAGDGSSALPVDGQEEPDGRVLPGDFDVRVAQIAAGCGLTPRETEIFSLLARGRSVPYIRDALIISKGTVVTHTKHIYEKLDVHSRQELIDMVDGPVAVPEPLVPAAGA